MLMLNIISKKKINEKYWIIYKIVIIFLFNN